MNKEREMELPHFSHDHPLIFEEEHQEDGAEVSCYGCSQRIYGPRYFCRKCKHFFLHKVCAELPEKMEHPMHPKHPLVLLSCPPYSQSSSYQSPCECDVCGQPCKSFTYNCSLFEFNVDVMCALMEHKINHKCHDHLLTPLLRPILFLCDACGTRHEGTSYKCSTCKFWVNQKCASLPSTMDTSDYHFHRHPLSLTYSIPYERFRSRAYCRVCFQEIERVNWAYVCSDCKYFAHVNCLTKPQPRRFDLPLLEFVLDFSGEFFCGVGLVCDICKFGLHTRCALLRQTIRNKYDPRHPFSLRYSGTDDEYYYEICEEEINLNYWFYDCRRSLRTKCIRPVSSLPQHLITHEAHEHTLALQNTRIDRTGMINPLLSKILCRTGKTGLSV